MAVSRVRYGRRMIRHVVLFRWTEEATEEQKQRVAAEIARLPSLVPSLRAFHIGSDLGINLVISTSRLRLISTTPTGTSPTGTTRNTGR